MSRTSETSRVRIRGIYTTALTERLRSEFEVVHASPPIRRRFGAEFPAEEYDASVETTDDRQGAGIVGDPEAVEAIADDLADLDIDIFRWTDPAPRGAVFDGVVIDTLGGGAVVNLGDREGYLSFGELDRRINEGDRVRVQVHDPAAPWADHRSALGTELQAFGGVASLSKGIDRVVASGDDATKTELARTTEMLPTEVPDDWGVRWEYAAADATMDAMNDALEAAVEQAESIDAGLADAPASADAGASASASDPPRRLLAPEATTWCWFGRESRFALDEDRRDVTTTMPGHHRVKAAHQSASAAVDFVEDLSSDAGGLAAGEEFPTGAALRQFGPSEGDRLEIRHGKPDGRCFSLGRGEVSECNPDEGKATVRRKMSGGGVYDALGTDRESGDVAVTKFREGRWWYPTVYRSADGASKGTYVNVCTPVELFPDSARYVDLHVDVVKTPDGEVERVDDDELDAAVGSGNISESLAEKARTVASSVERALK
jgi:Ribonuclease G/E